LFELTNKTALRHTGERESRGPALLDCQAKPSCGMWVPHVFKEIRPLPGEKEGEVSKAPVREEIYACKACGAERRWGLL
jgi:hypothetical protein